MTAMDRLGEDQRVALMSLATSFATDPAGPTDAELELAARHLLGELTFVELQTEMLARDPGDR